MNGGIPDRQALGAPQECPEQSDEGVMWQQATRFQVTAAVPASGGNEEIARVDLAAVPGNSVIMLMVNRVWAQADSELSAGWWTFQCTRNDAGVLQESIAGPGGDIGATTGAVPFDLTFDGDEAIIAVVASGVAVGQAFVAVSAFFCVMPFALVTKIYP